LGQDISQLSINLPVAYQEYSYHSIFVEDISHQNYGMVWTIGRIIKPVAMMQVILNFIFHPVVLIMASGVVVIWHRGWPSSVFTIPLFLLAGWGTGHQCGGKEHTEWFPEGKTALLCQTSCFSKQLTTNQWC